LNYIFYNQFSSIHYRSGFNSKLVTIQPLTRGTGNHGGPTVSSGIGAGGNNRPIEIHVHNKIGGREFQSHKKVALEDIGLQV
jgi:hypothetical protein